MRRMFAGMLSMLSLAGCSSPDHDPFQRTNRSIYNFNMAVDRAVVRDWAMGYEKHVPGPVRNGVDNFFSNLGTLNVILNDDLQGNFAQGWRNAERMAVNTTIGVLGVMDVADKWGRPHTRNDFGITLGKWGFHSGPYLMLPVLGPSSARDLPAVIVSRVTNPMFWLNPPLAVSLPMDVVSFTDQRARLEPDLELSERAALDPYTFVRDVYLRYRSATIGEQVEEQYDIYGEGETGTTRPVDKSPGATDYIR